MASNRIRAFLERKETYRKNLEYYVRKLPEREALWKHIRKNHIEISDEKVAERCIQRKKDTSAFRCDERELKKVIVEALLESDHFDQLLSYLAMPEDEWDGSFPCVLTFNLPEEIEAFLYKYDKSSKSKYVKVKCTRASIAIFRNEAYAHEMMYSGFSRRTPFFVKTVYATLSRNVGLNYED